MGWNRGCPATGRMYHIFDPATHRCKCGRWERGYKPHKEPTRPRAECQICERQQALESSGCLGHHGYRRPGCGWIEGDCYGVGHLPYPATDALVKYLHSVVAYRDRCETALAELPRVTELPFHWRERVERKDVKRTTMICKGKPLPRCGNYCVPEFNDLLSREQRRLEREREQASREISRVKKRIAAAKA